MAKKSKTLPFIKKTHSSPEQKTVVAVEQKTSGFCDVASRM